MDHQISKFGIDKCGEEIEEDIQNSIAIKIFETTTIAATKSIKLMQLHYSTWRYKLLLSTIPNRNSVIKVNSGMSYQQMEFFLCESSFQYQSPPENLNNSNIKRKFN
ncbi:hypothetical protein ACTA71_009960 [Dictyostelium dimigraforme]